MKTILALTFFALSLQLSAQDSWTFRKTGKNIIAKNTSTGKEMVLYKDEDGTTVEDGDTTDFSEQYDIVSYVGPYLTVLNTSYSFMKGAAHDNRERIFKVTNANTNKTVRLTDLFNENDIFNALMQDKFVKSNLQEDASPKNLAELTESFRNDDIARFDDGMYNSFAFHHVEPGKVAIRMGLSYNFGAARGALTQLGFFLPIPEKLKAAINTAVTNKTLMKDLKPKIGLYE